MPAPLSHAAFRPYAAREDHVVKDARHARSSRFLLAGAEPPIRTAGVPSLDRTLNGGAAADNREGGLRSRGEVCQPPPLDHPDRPGVSTTAPRTGFLRFPVSPF